jgi:putative tributyrin esterase
MSVVRLRTYWLLLCLLCTVLSGGRASAQAMLRLDSLYSPSLGKTMKYMVILPAQYNVSKRYPVLFLLHGVFGSHTDWSSKTGITEFCAPYPLVVVMPDGQDSWYVNAWNDPKAKFEDYLTQDVRSHIIGKYSVDTALCAIAGLSMGGFGAVKTALRYPGQYFFAGGLSSAITFVDTSTWKERGPINPLLVLSVLTAFGGAPQSFVDEQNTLLLARRAAGPSAPYIYLAAGIQDGFRSFLPAHHALTDSLRVNGIPYEYHEVPGGHTWIFWNREIQPLLQRLMDIVSRRQ